MLGGIEPADGDGRFALAVDLGKHRTERLDRVAQMFHIDRCAAVADRLEARQVVAIRFELFEHLDNLGRCQEGDVRHAVRFDQGEQRLGLEALALEHDVGGRTRHGRQRNDAAAMRHRRGMRHYFARLYVVDVSQVIHDDDPHGAVCPGRALWLAGGARGVEQPARVGGGHLDGFLQSRRGGQQVRVRYRTGNLFGADTPFQAGKFAQMLDDAGLILGAVNENPSP